VVKSSRSVQRPVVTTDGANLVSHAGLGLVGELADRTGVTGGLSEVFAHCGHRWRVHEPGVSLVGVAAAIADGARRVAGVDTVRQSVLFPRVGSYSTIWRTIYKAGGDRELHGIAQVLAEARERVWARAPAGRLPEALTIDVDSTLVNVHSEKERAASTYKRGFGMHPIGAWCDDTNEPLAAIMRPGNAGANSAVDHIDVIDQAVDALPARYRRGHRVGDERCEAVHPILVRADSAGATHLFLTHLRARNLGFSVGYHITAAVQTALAQTTEKSWIDAVEKNGEPRDGAQIVELTATVPLDTWPAGTRLIVRRERPHPGAQLSLFDHLAGWRHTAFLTDTAGDDIAALECRHRQHARVEDRIRTWKTCGLTDLPHWDYRSNEAWCALTILAATLIAWLQLVALTGDFAVAEPATLRYRLFHTAGRLARPTTPTPRVPPQPPSPHRQRDNAINHSPRAYK
jgi:hypothetical protein